jgi:nicotinamidase-related amidase/type 1 glutamine amidotransferase
MRILFPGIVVFLSTLRPVAAADLELTARYRVPNPAESGRFEVQEKRLLWDPKRTALIICDMWDNHWCQGATDRVRQVAVRLNRVVKHARRQGILVIHAPSDCMEFYKDTPQRRLAQLAPPAKNAPKDIDAWCRLLPDEPRLPVDDSDGGCDDHPRCVTPNPWKQPWKCQIDSIQVSKCDAVSASGKEIWNLLTQRGIENVMLAGVHTNMCILGRPFGLRQLAKNGKNVVLLRDLTDCLYNSRKPPFVSHSRGTELVVEHIEKHICPTIQSGELLGDLRRPHVVFLIGEDEYHTEETLPEFARSELLARGFDCTFVHADTKDPDRFPGLETLYEADLLVLSVRRRIPPTSQLNQIRDYLARGKPLVAIRTASHAFDRKNGTGWVSFDTEVLGAKYLGHYSSKPPVSTNVRVRPEAAKHSIIAGLPAAPFPVTSHLYKCRNLADSVTVLLYGQAEGQSEREPVAWTNTYKGGRVFYTSLGNPADFRLPAMRRLLLNAVHWALERPVPLPGKL